MNECTNCANLQEHINRLEIQAQKLRYEIMRLKKIIDNADALAGMVTTEAQAVLSVSSPKGVWAYNKGKKEAAGRISAVLYY